ncbi:Outer membrane protein assembly factor BamE, lipoprotein component of the BamABCDE complex [Salinihabitans flavidus]|uniref:Outer membrane protein assembly factor BamE, lipoprotein component of the BamABCDE complex n=1 Tax=Salinihabitans flavidus TaxID=569882 RepID=A0A1H8PQI0_9RHOB|nr:outer membrane protein assembly factor BamE [Salinihabitans flavidus]SEO43934.1 Outer membrane protein assembly factor BamE, lipoprotein component of the BamABCDE complex [Salinihabitans flavidus]
MAVKGKVLKSAVFGLCIALVTACSPTYRNHGYIPPEEDLAEIDVGVATRDSVAETIGAPTASGLLSESAYYYVRKRVRHFGPTRPQILERQVLAISFDSRGVVQNIERFTLEDGNVIRLSRRVTDNGIQDTNFLRNLLQSLGRFDPANFLN